ncbi:MAG: anti-sigma factor family protein [Planctomycetota bacterium]|jgi:hypothetical protein
MSCEEYRLDLGAYLDGELDVAREAAVEGHLEACPPCATELDRLIEQDSALGVLASGYEPAPGFEARVRELIANDGMAAARGGAGNVVAGPWNRVFSLALAAAVLIAVGVFVYLQWGQKAPSTGEVAQGTDGAARIQRTEQGFPSRGEEVAPWELVAPGPIEAPEVTLSRLTPELEEAVLQDLDRLVDYEAAQSQDLLEMLDLLEGGDGEAG